VLRGRYALPAISAISVLLSLGVVHLTPRRLGRLPILLAGLTMLLLGLIAPFRYIMPVYARPPILSAEEALRVPNPLALNFGDKIELVGYELGVDRATAGQFVPVTLYWRALTAVEQNYTVGLSLFGTDGKPYGQLAAYPGHGNYPTSLWQEGEIIEDAYQVRLRQRFPAPGLARAYVALYTYPDEEYLLLLDSQGAPVDRAAVLGPFPVQLSRSPEYQIENRLECRFGDQAALVGHEFDAGLFDTGYGCLTLYWETLAEIPEDYTVFVHVVDEQGKTVAQSDSPPRGGAYPTSYWQEGETIPDEHCLGFPSDVIPGSYRVFAGMYLLETMQRVPVFDASGGRVRDDQCSILEWQTSSRSTRLFLPLASR
jgi:hypothetical protein